MGLAGSTLNSSFCILEKEKRSNNIQSGNRKGRRITQAQVGECLTGIGKGTMAMESLAGV